MYISCLATDYDGTLAHDGVVDDATADALIAFRRSGRRLLLVTGRELPDLVRVFPRIDLFDRAAADAAALRVCADPNNLPFSDQAGRGFENKIVGLIAQDLGSTVDYTWWAQRRGYVSHTLKADVCDIWPGVASGAEMMTSTRPYYRSS